MLAFDLGFDTPDNLSSISQGFFSIDSGLCIEIE